MKYSNRVEQAALCLKRIIVLSIILTLSSNLLLGQINSKPFVIPEIMSWTGAEGNINLSGRVVIKNSKLSETANHLANDYKTMFGKSLKVVKGGARNGDIIFQLVNDKELGEEGYRITIKNNITVLANTQCGAYWATRTLLQIMEQNENQTFPCGNILDVPQYRLRGFMIDCGRKFFPIEYLRNLTKVMSYYKMNTLQIHLNDNGFKQFFDNDWNKTQSAFRLESATYPGLTAKDGSYSKAEFIDLQKLAEELHVEIIPEIDAPAHSLAFTKYKPEIGSKEYGMDHLDLFNPDTYKFMDNLFKEYLEGNNPVFRGKRVHIGTDEYSNAKREVVEKFREYTNHYIELVESYGKQAVLWGALTHANGTTPVKSENVIMDIWYNGYANPKEMKEQGYKLISIPDGYVYIVPAAGYYYDYLNCNFLYNNWTPAVIGNQKFEENDPCIEGGMFAVWNDHVGNGITVKDVHHRVFPALQTLSVKCWSGKNTRLSYQDYENLRNNLSEAPGVNELARHGKSGDVVISKEKLLPNEQLNIEEIGYDYAVSFTINGVKEDKGTELLRSANAVVYLSDPQQGKLGFEREGYLNTFDYRIEAGKTVNISILGDNKSTRLYIDGKLKEELGPKKLYVRAQKNRAHYMVNGTFEFEPVVYNEGDKITYQRTLVFPLRKSGNFKSCINNFNVMVR